MQSLLQDMEILLEQQIVHQSSQAKYNQNLIDLKDKLGKIHISKGEFNVDYDSLEDFVTFVKTVWIKINKSINKELRNTKFLSAKRGRLIYILYTVNNMSDG